MSDPVAAVVADPVRRSLILVGGLLIAVAQRLVALAERLLVVSERLIGVAQGLLGEARTFLSIRPGSSIGFTHLARSHAKQAGYEDLYRRPRGR